MTEIIWPLFSLKLFSYVLLSVSAFSSFFFSSFCWPCSCSIDACLASAASESHTHTHTQPLKSPWNIVVEICVMIFCSEWVPSEWESKQRIHWWASDAMLHFSKSDEETNSSLSWMAWESIFSVNYSSKAFRSHRVWTAVQWHISPVHVGPLCCSPVSAVGLVSEWRSLCSSPDLGYRLALCMPGQATWLYFLRGTQWHFYNATDKCVYMLYQISWFPAHTPSALMLPSVWSASDQRLHRFL